MEDPKGFLLNQSLVNGLKLKTIPLKTRVRGKGEGERGKTSIKKERRQETNRDERKRESGNGEIL